MRTTPLASSALSRGMSGIGETYLTDYPERRSGQSGLSVFTLYIHDQNESVSFVVHLHHETHAACGIIDPVPVRSCVSGEG